MEKKDEEEEDKNDIIVTITESVGLLLTYLF